MLGSIIAAISTPPGKGGVAVIRVSGEGALELSARVFHPASKRALLEYPPRTAIYGFVKDGDEILDDCILTAFPAPASYTGEDTFELSCHGGILLTRTVLELLFKEGAVPAEAGEFTRRAFINGKLTLTEAEAIGTLLDATSREQLRLAGGEQRALLRGELEKIRNILTEVLSSTLARIDYPDEDLGEYSDAECLEALSSARAIISRLTDTYRTGRAIMEGIDTVIVGKPNVGKSTLYNLIVGEDAAIVTDVPGTTRDALVRSTSLGRVTLRLTDTAGIRGGEGLDRVEKIGIERSLERLRTAELVIHVLESSGISDEDKSIIELLSESPAAKLCVINKCDTGTPVPYEIPAVFDKVLEISAEVRPAEALTALEGAVEELFIDERLSPRHDAMVASARQQAALLRARDMLERAIEALCLGMPADAVSSDIELALGAALELDGRAVSEEITSRIFSRFCVGK
ncbi:MAG: tRNA uridine-5-carboxymethylaminomethyl(34) synthesis GTPase MnmE [Clostridia bacterium]|nr:tRNA uridine-5-carboxymethylaminomethyl(34) synthesis GTPase MnmE [Clostridia bacterium]